MVSTPFLGFLEKSPPRGPSRSTGPSMCSEAGSTPRWWRWKMWKMEQVGLYPAALARMSIQSCGSSGALAYFLILLLMNHVKMPGWLSSIYLHLNFPKLGEKTMLWKHNLCSYKQRNLQMGEWIWMRHLVDGLGGLSCALNRMQLATSRIDHLHRVFGNSRGCRRE